MIIDIPLVTPNSRKYFDYASDKEKHKHYRALDIRLCLERICDEIIFELASDVDKKKWVDYSLHKKLEISKQFLDNTTVSGLLDSKKIGNIGAHEGEEGNISDKELEQALKSIRDFSLSVFLSFFKKYGFEANSIPWVPTVFSTLPPIYRVAVLEKYYLFNPSLFVIEKLSMAYLKSGKEREARNFLQQCFHNNEIDSYLYSAFNDKLTLLRDNIDKFPIANNLDEARKNFDRVLPGIAEKERTIFIILVSMILTGNKPTL